MNPRNLILLVSLLVAVCSGGLGYYFKDLLPPWAIGAFVGLPLLGGLISAILMPSPKEKSQTKITPPPERSDTPPAESPPEKPKEPTPPSPKHSPEAYVASFLGALQREGRFLDFLQEDLNQYEDAQIGAAVRSIHGKLKLVVFEMVDLAPVIDAKEGAEVFINEDFDPKKIRLIGNVKGNPPFKGFLRHPGWRFRKMNLPKPKADDVLAPAEVEIP